jgi:hypothetical protein
MRNSMPIWIAATAATLMAVACGGTAIPSTSPEAVSTIVAATLSAITPAASPTTPPPTAVLPTVPPPPSAVPPTVPVVAPTIVLPGATRINFLSGATSGVISAPIAAGQTLNYVLQALQGQPMLLNVDSLNHDVTLSLKTQGGTTMLGAAAHQSTWQGTLPQTEDYYVSVHGGASTENFTLSVTIPSRIKFAEGATQAKVSGKTVGGYNVIYTVFAIKGQQMTVDLSNLSGDAALTIYGFTDGQPYVRYVSEQTHFSFELPATQDYIIEVVPRAGSVVSFLMAVKIE